MPAKGTLALECNVFLRQKITFNANSETPSTNYGFCILCFFILVTFDTYPENVTNSPILAPSGTIKGSTAVWSALEAHRTW